MNKHNKNELIELYKKYGTIRKLAKYFGCRGTTASKILKNAGIPIKRGSQGRTRKHLVNKTYFNKLDSPEKLYWLGFLTADSYNSPKGYVEIQLAEKDLNHILNFKKAIGSSAPIFKRIVKNSKRKNKYKNTINYGVHIYSTDISEQLKNLGILPNTDRKIPDIVIHSKFINHYIRGYIDGDGCFGFQKNQPYIKIRGGKEILQQIHNTFEQYKIITPRNKTFTLDSGIYSAKYSGKNICKNITKWLYKNSTETTRLERKYNIYGKIIS